MRGRRPWLVNGRINGSGRACQRPRTSNGAKCFSCEGALAREIAFFKFLENFGNYCCAGRSEFGRRGTRRSQTARAWPRAAQHKFVACFDGANNEKTPLKKKLFILNLFVGGF